MNIYSILFARCLVISLESFDHQLQSGFKLYLMNDLRTSIALLPPLIDEVLQLLSEQTPVELNQIHITYIIKKCDYQLDLIIQPLTEVLTNLIQSQRRLFNQCRQVTNRIVGISSAHPHLYHAHTFLEISARMIINLSRQSGHLESVNKLISEMSSYSNASYIIGRYEHIIRECKYDVRLIKINLEDAKRIIDEMIQGDINKYIPIYLKYRQDSVIVRNSVDRCRVSGRKTQSSP